MSLTKMNRNKCGWKQLQIQQRRLQMISVGIDVSKKKKYRMYIKAIWRDCYETERCTTHGIRTFKTGR